MVTNGKPPREPARESVRAPARSPSTRKEGIQFALFWSWNLIFLAFMSLGFAPVLLPQTIASARTGLIPVSFLLYALVLGAIPVLAVILGLTVLRRSPGRLFALGYVIEGPLMLLLAVRFFAIRELTAGTAALMAIALTGMAAFLWTLLDRRAGERAAAVEGLRLAGLTLMALTSLYAAAWIAFYVLPIIVEIGRVLLEFFKNLPRSLIDLFRGLGSMLRDDPLMLPFSVLGFILLLYSATLFVLTPLAVPYLSLHVWRRSLDAPARRHVQSRVRRAGPGLLALLVCAGLIFLANRQPQAQAFALLERPPTTPAEAQALLDRSGAIREGLLNAYLAPFRYLSADGEVRHVSDMYQGTLRLPAGAAFAVQRLYERLARPLLYRPVHRPDWTNPVDNRALAQEPEEAARLYQRFFDAPITMAERPTIVRAVRSTWSPAQAEAAWQAVDDREVYLLRQELSVQERGDWATIDLHEVYQNRTAERQEVVYYFSLPESAVLTGLWLGETGDRTVAEQFQVAPRGAAQAVYREQVRRQVDPALLEQIGPRQYRLRVFPILPVRVTFTAGGRDSGLEAAPELHMWLEWREVLDRSASDGGSWPLPQLAELRNVYWDRGTQRLVNGQPLATAAEDEWLPAGLPAGAPGPAQVHRIDLPGGQTVLAVPEELAQVPSLPGGLRLAVVLDRSRSMEAHRDEAAAILEALRTMDSSPEQVDVYLTASPYRGEAPEIVPLQALDTGSLVYFGGQNAGDLLAQFNSRAQEQPGGSPAYDAALVLTDGSGYELGQSENTAPIPDFPVWVIHAGGQIPLGYDDATLEILQASGGGMAGSLESALQRLALSLGTAGSPGNIVDLVDGYLWRVLPTDQVREMLSSDLVVQLHSGDDPFAALAARRLILAEMQRRRGDIDQLETLDGLHVLAAQYGIVTPYSSMLVLVNAAQQAQLEALAQSEDRYEREMEQVGETTPEAPAPLVGVPEPHEWLLLGLAAALLGYSALKKRLAAVRITG